MLSVQAIFELHHDYLFYIASQEDRTVSGSVDIKMERNPAYVCIEKNKNENLQTYANL